jgi:hypothetical protein
VLVFVGENLATTVHVCPGVSTVLLLHVPPVIEKGADGGVIELKTRSAFPVFCTVVVSVEELPTPTEPNAKGLGVADIMGACEAPLSGTT